MINKILSLIPPERQIVILVCGNVKTGKSTLAKKLKDRLGAIYINTDALRKEFFPNPTHSKEETKQVYEEMQFRFTLALVEGQNVVLDGTYLKTNFRINIYETVQEANKQRGFFYLTIYVTAPEEIVRERLTRKNRDYPSDPFRAGIQTYLEKKENMETNPDYSHPLQDKGVKVVEYNTHKRKIVRKNF